MIADVQNELGFVQIAQRRDLTRPISRAVQPWPSTDNVFDGIMLPNTMV